MSKRTLLSKMIPLLHAAAGHACDIPCDNCVIRAECHAASCLSCNWVFLCCVVIGKIYRNGRLHRKKCVNTVNSVFAQSVEFRNAYIDRCEECPIHHECEELGLSCYSTFLAALACGGLIQGEGSEWRRKDDAK